MKAPALQQAGKWQKNPYGEEQGENGPVLRSPLPGQYLLESVPKDKTSPQHCLAHPKTKLQKGSIAAAVRLDLSPNASLSYLVGCATCVVKGCPTPSSMGDVG